MPVFVWEGKTAQGKVMKGEMEALNQQAVLSRLRNQRIQPTRLDRFTVHRRTNAARVRKV